MALNTLFLPLLGGFLFYCIFNGTSHLAPSQPTQALLFWSAAIGLVLLFIARLAIYADQEVLADRDSALKWELLFAIPEVICFCAGLLAWAATTLLDGTLSTVGKPKVVAGVIFGTLAFCLVVMMTRLVRDLIPTIIGVESRYVWVTASLLLFWWSTQIARFGNLPLGAALVRISSVVLIAVLAIYALIRFRDDIVEVWRALTKPVENTDGTKGLGSAFAACILGTLSAWVVNFAYTKDVAEARYARGKGPSELERLFYSASQQRRLVMLTMDDRKVYVGTIKRLAIRGVRNPYLVVFPTISGHRESDSLGVIFTTFYQQVYQRLPEEEWEQFQKVLPVDRIVSAGYYNQQYYDLFAIAKIWTPPSTA